MQNRLFAWKRTALSLVAIASGAVFGSVVPAQAPDNASSRYASTPRYASPSVDAAVDAWARDRLVPLQGEAAATAAAAFGAAPPPTSPAPLNPFRFNPAPAAETTARLIETPRPTAPNHLSGGNPLRGVAAPPARIDSAAAREAFTPSSLPPQDREPHRIAVDPQANHAAPQEAFGNPLRSFAPASPAAERAVSAEVTPPSSTPPPSPATLPAPEPSALPLQPQRVASLQAAELQPAELHAADEPLQSTAWSRDSLSDDRAAMVEGTGQPGPATLEGQQRASLVVEKRGPEEVRVGQMCRFVVTVRNTGTTTAAGVTLTDETPIGATFVRSTPPADQQGSRLRWELGSLAGGQETTVEMLLMPQREGPLGSVATVSFAAQASASTRATRPQLTLRVSSEPRVRVGEAQRVVIDLHNPGTGAATGVMLSEDIPAEVSHPAGAQLEFEVGALAPGESRRLELVLMAERAGRVVNAVTAIADGDLRAQGATEFEIVAPALAVQVEGPRRRFLERPASYRVTVANPGTAEAHDVRLVTHLPRGLEFVSANNLGEYDEQTHAVYWSLAELPEGQRGEVEVVALPIAPGDHTLRVEGEANGGLRVEEETRVRVEGVVSLAFDVRDRKDPIEVGGQAEYDIRVTNEGTKSATGVRVAIEAPRGMRFADARGETAARVANDLVEFAPLERLAPGAEARFQVTVLGETPGDHRVTVSVASDETPQPIRREESTRVFSDE